MRFVLRLLVAAAVAAAPDASAQQLKVGVLAPLSGEGARSYGHQVQNGVLLAREQSASADIALVFEDSKCDVKEAITAARKLIEIDKVNVIIGDACWTDLIAPFAERHRVPVISPGSAQSSVRDAGDYIFRLKLDVSVDSRELARTLRTQLPYQTAAVLHVEDQWGEGIARNFDAAFVEEGGRVLFTGSFHRDQSDFRTLLLKLSKSRSDIIMLAGYPQHIGLLARQLRNMGINTPLATYGGSLGEETLELGGETVEGLVYMEEFEPDARKESRHFAEAYEAAYGATANLFGAMGYDAFMLYQSAALRCGTDAECVKDALYQVKDYLGASGVLTFDSYGDVVKPMQLFTITDGKRVPYQFEHRSATGLRMQRR